jgi:hypothetical protein
MKKQLLLICMLSSISAISLANTQVCHVNSGCYFSIPTNHLITLSLDNIQKGHTYQCVIDGIVRLANIDNVSAESQGLKDVDVSNRGYFINANFDATQLKTEHGNLNFELICGYGDIPCTTQVTCKFQ